MTIKRGIISGGVGAFIALIGAHCATSLLAARFDHQPALGPSVSIFGAPFHQPFAILEWSTRWGALYPGAFALPKLIFAIGLLCGLAVVLIGFMRTRPEPRPFGKDVWGDQDDAAEAGLLAESGIVIGKLDGEILVYDGPDHLLLTGGTRSGKTRGSVIPTLLACPHSILVLDLKGELHSGDDRVGFAGTAGWRDKIGPVLRFAPTEEISDALNLFDTIRPGPQEVRDVQNLVELIADPHGDGRFQEFWDRAAKQILSGLILHVAYAEPNERKTLARVFELLARFDDTVKVMEKTLHRANPRTGEPETHPEVLRAAHSYAAYHEKLRAGIKATAESYLGLFADPLVRQNTSRSTFAISDLMCADTPATLYLCWPPNDSKRVKPLIRLVFGTVLRVLMEHQERAADGRVKKHALLLLLDEFPQLGKLDVFEQSMGAMAGYGLKAYLVTQSLHQVTQAYGRFHTILDNCHVVTSFAATDVETAETISKLAGDLYEMRPQETWSGKRALLGLNHRAITYREERRPLILPADVRRLPERDELVFVTGAKPLRARKLRYDEEPIFKTRLLPRPPAPCRPALPSSWEVHAALTPRVAPAAPSQRAASKQEDGPRPLSGRRGSKNKCIAPEQPSFMALLDDETSAPTSETCVSTPREEARPPEPASTPNAFTTASMEPSRAKTPTAPKPASERIGFDLRATS